MKISKVLVLAVFLISLSIATLGQLSPIIQTVTKTSQITPTISLEEKETCITKFYDEAQNTYGNCVFYYNYTSCLNTTGPNTGCSLQQDAKNYSCKTGEITVTKNSTECKPTDDFVISIVQGAAVLKKQIDYSEWGPCIYSQETIQGNSCLVVTCQSIYDGANDGQFHGCKGGTSCQRFEICGSSVSTFYKNSREGFAADDPTFYLNKLAIQEVPQ